MKYVFASDLHLTARHQDEYKMEIWRHLRAACTTNKADHVIIPGDITEFKNNHDSKLVNKIVDELVLLAEDILPEHGRIMILRGNHDGLDENVPYFKFIENFPKIIFFDSIYTWEDDPDATFLFLPHTRDPEEDWKGVDVSNKVVITHITVDGAFAETGHALQSNIKSSFFEDSRITFSGDIHKPQECGKLHYIGCPYNVRYGDNFQGNLVVYDSTKNEFERIPLPFPRKLVFDIETVEDLEIQVRNAVVQEGIDKAMCKFRLHINQSNLEKYHEIIKRAPDVITAHKFVYAGFDVVKEFMKTVPTATNERGMYLTFEGFCQHQQIEQELVEFGKQIIEECSQ